MTCNVINSAPLNSVYYVFYSSVYFIIQGDIKNVVIVLMSSNSVWVLWWRPHRRSDLATLPYVGAIP